jgi:hypothetical protein
MFFASVLLLLTAPCRSSRMHEVSDPPWEGEGSVIASVEKVHGGEYWRRDMHLHGASASCFR